MYGDRRPYPVALLIESWCQSAALLAGWDLSAADTEGRVALFGGMTDLVVTGSVWPGDVVRNEVVLTRSLGDTWIFGGSATASLEDGFDAVWGVTWDGSSRATRRPRRMT